MIFKNDLDEAARRITLMLEQHPESPAFWEQLAIVRARQGGDQGPAAIEAMRRSIEMRPVPPEAYRRLAQLEGYFGQSEAVFEGWRHITTFLKLIFEFP